MEEMKFHGLNPEVKKIVMSVRDCGFVKGDTVYVSEELFKSLLEKINSDWDFTKWLEKREDPAEQMERLKNHYEYLELMENLNKEQQQRIEKYFYRAIEKGYMVCSFFDNRCVFFDDKQPVQGQKTELAWFIREILNSHPTINQKIPFVQLEYIFDTRQLERAIRTLDDRKRKWRWVEDLKKDIFFD